MLPGMEQSLPRCHRPRTACPRIAIHLCCVIRRRRLRQLNFKINNYTKLTCLFSIHSLDGGTIDQFTMHRHSPAGRPCSPRSEKGALTPLSVWDVRMFVCLSVCRQSRVCEAYTTKKPSCRWQTRATRNHATNCSNLTCLQRCRWQYWSIFIRLAVVASTICKIPRNSLKIQTRVQGHPRSSILVSIESAYATSH